MDDLLNWRSVAKRLEDMPRGARTNLAKALDMDRSQLARTLRQSDFPKTNQAAIITRFLEGLPPQDGMTEGEGHGGRKVPLYGYAAASDGERFAMNDGQVLDWLDLPMGMTVRGDFIVVQALGSSMEPRVWGGERKLVQLRVPPGRGQDAVIEFNDGTAVLKTYQSQKDGVIFCRQYNPERELRFQSTDVKAIHAVFPL